MHTGTFAPPIPSSSLSHCGANARIVSSGALRCVLRKTSFRALQVNHDLHSWLPTNTNLILS
ncbi:hypothetical protein C8Q80DRAFT_1192039 [Daedaleopsis nitida]|nr:hypothetical protein C8Q80DRAFT_1192039 [Daedaleopsis nitida]